MLGAIRELELRANGVAVIELGKILKAKEPLTLAGVPAGFLPWLAAVAASTFSDGGAARLRRRLKRFDRRTSPRSPSSSGAS